MKEEGPMKKILLPFAVLIAVSLAAGQTWFPGPFDQALAKARTEKKLVIVDFYSDG